MRLTQPFLQLPKLFDAERLAEEVQALPASAWVPHPGQYPGNDAVLLVTPGGEATNAFAGPMAPTEHLLKCRYMMEIMAEIGGVWGRSRLMGLAPGAQVPAHVDVGYYWRTHTRIHIPIVTNDKVLFTCADETVHMDAGDCWIFDSFRMHNVQNGGTAKRIHLVLDTVGGEELWNLMEQAEGAAGSIDARPYLPGQREPRNLRFERQNAPRIMSPWEIRCHIAFLSEHAPAHPSRPAIMRRLEKFADAWASTWAQFGPDDEGIPAYQRLIAPTQTDLKALGADALLLPNGVPLLRALGELIFTMAVPRAAPVPLRQPVGAPQRLAS